MKRRARIFIGSSKEHLNYARALQENLFRDMEVTVWDQGTFPPTQYILESLLSQLEFADFGVFILAPDDFVTFRGKKLHAPRDNVIFELGLFVGRLGRDRVFMVTPLQLGDLKLPSDLQGVSSVQYETERLDDNLIAAVAPASHAIRRWIERSSPKLQKVAADDRLVLSWDELLNAVDILHSKLAQTPRNGGFSMDAIIGIAHGGIIVADLLARRYPSTVPLISISPDRHSMQPRPRLATDLNCDVAQMIVNRGLRRLLIVDDMSNTGYTLRIAKSFLTERCGAGIEVRTAAAVANPSAQDAVDFYGQIRDTARLLTPFAASVLPL